MKLVSINVEGQKHLKEVGEFLRREKADVVALAEVFEDTLPTITNGYEYVEFAPGYLADQDENGVIPGKRKWGEVLMSHYPLENVQKIYLGEYTADHLPKHGEDTHAPVLIVATVAGYGLATVHGTWTKGGLVTERQQAEMGKIVEILHGQEIVLAGDFNIPRGNEMYKQLATCYRDNIPTGIQTTIDPILHYANREIPGRLKLVVDYVWSTSKYAVENVQVISGVSDHCALVCTISLV